MDDTKRGQVSGSAAEVYEEFFVPALFAQWPERVLDLAGVEPGERVLDVGCGTGVLTRAALERAGAGGRVVGLDPNPAMREVAARAVPGAEIRSGSAEAMPFPDQSFDRVVSQFVLMFVEDRAAAAAEMRRVLRPRGTVAAVTWAAVEESPGYAAMVALLDRLFGAGPADALRAPFTLGTTSSLVEALCGEFPDVTVHRWAGVARFASVRAWVHTDVAGWTLRDLIDEEQYERLQSEAAVALDRFVGVDGAVRFDAPALAAVATRS